MSPHNMQALQNFDALPRSGGVRVPVAAAVCSVTEMTIWRWAREGRLNLRRNGRTTTVNVGELRDMLAASREAA